MKIVSNISEIAVNTGAQVTQIVTGFGVGLSMGTTVPIGHSVGEPMASFFTTDTAVIRSAAENEIPYLKEKMNKSFSIAVQEHFGDEKAEGGPPTEQLEDAYREADSRVYKIMKNGTAVVCAVLKINEDTKHNKMDLFFILKEYLNQGLGFDAWTAIERKFPQTFVWELITPYFEQRNIHFYVNKCGFHIVEYFNKYHPDPDMPPLPENGHDVEKKFDDGGCFRFEKWM